MRFDFLNVLNGAKRLNCLNGLNPTVEMVGARHRFSTLERAFRYQKAASKRLHEAHIRDLHQDINRLRWSDPGLALWSERSSASRKAAIS